MQKKEYHFFILFLCWQQTNTIIHRLMKTTILLGLLLTLTVSCKHHSNPVTTEENFHTQEANRLVAEARNLWLPPLDSTFFFNDSEHMGQTWQRISHWPYQYKSICGKNQLFISLQKVPWDSVCTPASWKTIHPQCRLMVNESDVWRLFRRQPYRPKKLSVCRFRLCHPHKRICYRQPQVCRFPHQPRTEHGIDDW